MAENSKTIIFILGQAIKAKSKAFEKLTPEEFGYLSQSLKYYLIYAVPPITIAKIDPAVSEEKDHREQVRLFHSTLVPSNVLQEIINYLSKPQEDEVREEKKDQQPKEKDSDDYETKGEEEDEEEEEDENIKKILSDEEKEKLKKNAEEENATVVIPPQKEDSTVPSELETLVANYKQNQIDKSEVNNPHSVAETVKRARKVWEEKHRIDLIQENRLKAITDANERQKARDFEQDQYDNLLISAVNPKASSSEEIYQSLNSLSRQTINSQLATLNAGLPASQKITLSASQLRHATEELSYLALTGAIDINNFQSLFTASQIALIDQGIDLSTPIAEIAKIETNWRQASASDPYSDTPDQIESNLNRLNDSAQQYIKTNTSLFVDQELSKNLNLDDDITNSLKEIERVQNSLSERFPNAALPPDTPSPLARHLTELEKELRKIDPGIRISPEAVGAQTSSILQTVNGSTRHFGAEAVYLFSLGVTPEKVAQIATFAKENPDSDIGKFYAKHQDVFKQVHFQIQNFRKTELGKQINDNLKPLGSIGSGITGFYNRLSPTLQTATKIVLNPKGTFTAFVSREAGKRIGQHLLEFSGSAFAKTVGGYLAKEGLVQGVKTFTNQAVKKGLVKAATWAAVKLGIGITLAAVPGIGPLLDIAAQILLWLAEKTLIAAYNAAQDAAEKIWGERLKARDFALPALAGVGSLMAAGATFVGGLIVIRKTIQFAVVSITSILIISASIVLFYYGLSHAVAPILSTIVQLDSKDKVKYADYVDTSEIKPGCGGSWPVKGLVIQGSKTHGGTHDVIEAIDIRTTTPTAPLRANVDGVIKLTGWGNQYGEWIWMEAKTPDGRTYSIIYAHLAQINVSVNQKVTQGTILGITDSTSSVPGFQNPHLHLEYRGIKYNQCPAGGIKVPDGCIGFTACGSIVAK